MKRRESLLDKARACRAHKNTPVVDANDLELIDAYLNDEITMAQLRAARNMGHGQTAYVYVAVGARLLRRIAKGGAA